MVAAVRIWIFCSTVLVSAGWILSAFHQLNRAGYACTFLIGAGFVFWKRDWFWPAAENRAWRWRRFRRPAPFLFVLLAVLSLVSGLLYAGLNWDANAYRLPRVLHWLGAGQWHWIHAADVRLNVAGCGFEWLSAPLLLFTGTDRFLFLINWTAYLLLPGLIFSVFTRLQVRPRVAWWWMWFFAAGWCFALEAASIANDAFAAIYILAAVDLALRARTENRPADLWLSLFAVALVTGVKQTNVPLALVWLVAACPSWRFLRQQPFTAAWVISFGGLVSIAPICLANLHYAGNVLPMEYAGLGNFKLDPFWGLVGNAIAIPAQNLLPPFYHLLPPFTTNWGFIGSEIQGTLMRSSFGQHFRSFENFLLLDHGSGVTELNAGFGLGGCLLLLMAVGEAWRNRAAEAPLLRQHWLWWLRVLPWFLLLIFMAKVGSYENARHLAPYYPLLLPALLVQRGQGLVARQRPWQRLGLGVMGLTVIMIIAEVDRPLFPAETCFKWLYHKFPNSDLIVAECGIYRGSYFRVFEARRHIEQQILPRHEPIIGFYAGSSGLDEYAAWLPFDGHRVERVSAGDPAESLPARGLQYVVASDMALRETGVMPADCMNHFHATLAATVLPGAATNLDQIRCEFYLFRTAASASPKTAQ